MMKKYIIGTIFGFVLATAVGANAQGVTKVIGEVIDGAFSVKVNGVELTDQAIVVQGTSYLPVRAFGDATGYDIKFNPELGIELTKKSDSPTTPIETPVVTPTPTPTPPTMSNSDIQAKIEYYESLIKTAKWNISSFEDNIKNNPSDKDDEFKNTITDLKTKITEYQLKISDLEKQKQ